VGHVLLDGEGDETPLRRVLLARDAFALADASVAATLRAFLARAQASLPPIEEVIVALHGFDAWRAAFRAIQGREIWRIYGTWIEQHRPEYGPGIAERMAYAASVSEEEAAAAHITANAARQQIRALLARDAVLILPTTPAIAPPITSSAAVLETFRAKMMSLTCIAGLGGLPQVTLPAGLAEGCPVGLSLIGAAGTDESLLDLAVALARYCGGLEAREAP
jgi:amidase